MIDCLMCPRAHLIPDRCDPSIIYCPFLAMKECIYGEHFIGEFVPVSSIILVTPTKPKLYIPPFRPFVSIYKSPKKEPKIDWEAKHERIFTLLGEGKTMREIARAVNVSVESLYKYKRRY